MSAATAINTTGSERADALLRAKRKANAAFYAALPKLGSAALSMATETRQTERRTVRGHCARPWLECQEDAPVRLRACARIMLRAAPRKRLSPRIAPRHPLAKQEG